MVNKKLYYKLSSLKPSLLIDGRADSVIFI